MGLRTLTKNVSYLFMARILATLFGSGSMVFLVRYLGPEKLGIYSFVITVLFILNSFSDLGIAMYLTKEIAQDGEKAQDLFSNHLSMQVAATLCALTLLCCAAYSANSTLVRNMLLLGGLGMFWNNCIYPFATILSAREDMKFNVVSALLGGFATFIITVCGILLRCNLYYFLLLVIVPSFISFVVALAFSKKYIKIRFTWNSNVVMSIISNSWPFFALTATGLLYSRIDLLMLKLMDSNQAAGLYNAAYKILFLLFAVPMSVRSAIYPMFSNYYKNSKDKLPFAVGKTIKYMLIISTLISALVFLHADYIVSLLFGDQFHQSSACLKILIWMFIPYCAYIVAMYYLNAAGKIKYVMNVSLLGLVVNMALNCVLIPKYSLFGAAMATLATEIIVFAGMLHKTLTMYKFVNKDRFMMKFLCVSISGALVAIYLPIYVCGLFFLCYFIMMLYLSHAIDDDEKYAFKFIFKQIHIQD